MRDPKMVIRGMKYRRNLRLPPELYGRVANHAAALELPVGTLLAQLLDKFASSQLPPRMYAPEAPREGWRVVPVVVSRDVYERAKAAAARAGRSLNVAFADWLADWYELAGTQARQEPQHQILLDDLLQRVVATGSLSSDAAARLIAHIQSLPEDLRSPEVVAEVVDHPDDYALDSIIRWGWWDRLEEVFRVARRVRQAREEILRSAVAGRGETEEGTP
jgi:predicted HicB family RNase H-like nuclease